MEKMETWVSGGPQRKIQPEMQRQNVENQRRSRSDDQRRRKKLRVLKLALVKQLYIIKGNIIGVAQLRIWKKLIDRLIERLISTAISIRITLRRYNNKREWEEKQIKSICNGVSSKTNSCWNCKVALKGNCRRGRW